MHRMWNARLASLALLAGMTLPWANSVLAQLPEIVVTAERRETDAQTTSVTLSAFSGDDLRDLGVFESDDLQFVTPGLVISDTGGDARMYVRGVGTDVFPTGADPSVATYIDGAYLSRATQMSFDMLDVERVEVLKGPQGTLFGRNATGGAINVITRKPENEFGGFADVSFGDYDAVRISGGVNVPIVDDRVLFRIAAQSNSREGWTENRSPGATEDKLDSEDAVMARAQLRFLPNDDVDILLGLEYYEESPTSDGFFSNIESTNRAAGVTNFSIFAGGSPSSEEDRYVYHNYTPDHNAEETSFRAALTWDASDDLTLSANVALLQLDTFFTADTDVTELPFGTIDQGQVSDTLTVEGLFTYEPGERFSVTGGVFYLDDDLDEVLGIGTPGPAITQLIDYANTAYAVFAQGGWFVTDSLRIIAGVRYSNEEKDFTNNESFVFPVPFIPPRSSTFGGANDWSSTTPKFGLEYVANDDVFLFLTATEGFKSGGFNASARQGAFDEEKIWSYEGGIKSTWFGDRLLANASIYRYTYEGLQVNTSDRVTVVQIVDNVGEAEGSGFDLELIANPIENLTLSFVGSWLDTEFESGEIIIPTGGLADVTGNPLTRAPEFSATAGLRYTFGGDALGGLTLTPHVYVSYKSDMEFIPTALPRTDEDGYSLVNARLELADDDGRWAVEAFGNNLSDETFRNTTFISNSGIFVSVIGPPRTYGARVRFQF